MLQSLSSGFLRIHRIISVSLAVDAALHPETAFQGLMGFDNAPAAPLKSQPGLVWAGIPVDFPGLPLRALQ
jgi:hypothetical protein